MEHYVRGDGKVGVLYSPGYGAGWSTWEGKELAYDAQLIKWLYKYGIVEKESASMDYIQFDAESFADYVEQLYGKRPYIGSCDHGLCVEYFSAGTVVRVTEYDGSEDIRVYDPDDYVTL